MNRKRLSKLIIDLAMMGLLLAALSCSITGNLFHEMTGVSLFALFIVHNILNIRWYQKVLKEKKNLLWILNLTINLFLIVMMITMTASAVLISRIVFAFIPIKGSLITRQMHVLAVTWIFILISVHIGIHWRIVINVMRRMAGIAGVNRLRVIVPRIMAIVIALFGVYSSFERNIGSRLILYFTYEYWDMNKPVIFLLLQYLSIMGLYIFITYYVLKIIQNRKKQRKKLGFSFLSLP